MKVVCTQENLKAGLQIASRIISSSNTLPILNNLLLKTENGLLQISSTNLEISIHTTVRCKVEEVGEVCVPAKTFTELIGTLPSRNVVLSKLDGALKVEVEKNSATIKILPSDDFPSMPTIGTAQTIVFTGSMLHDALSKVVFAASTSETQPEIAGVFVQGFGAGVKVVATDRYRLAEKKVSLPGASFTNGFILPLRTTQELLKLIHSMVESVALALEDNQAKFTIGDTEIITRLIDANYPDYEQIIPTEFATEAVVARQELLGALKTSSIFSYGSNSIKLMVNTDTSIVIVLSGQQDLGESVVELPGKITGPSTEVLFNYRYIVDMLNNLTAENVVIKINSNTLPVVFTEEEDKSYIYLVMPIKN